LTQTPCLWSEYDVVMFPLVCQKLNIEQNTFVTDY